MEQEEQTINYFALLCELEDISQKCIDANINQACEQEKSDFYKQRIKLEKLVKREANRLDGIKQKRSRSPSSATMIIREYLKQYPSASSVTHDRENMPSLLCWASGNIDFVYGSYEILSVNNDGSITFFNNKTNKKNTVKHDSLVSALSREKSLISKTV